MTARQLLRTLPISIRLCCLIALVSMSLEVSAAFAQAASGQSAATELKPLAYDVASIKANKSGSGNSAFNGNIDKYSATNVTLKNLLSYAYGIKEDYVYGLPGWGSSARFDLQAKMVDADVKVLEKLSQKEKRSLLKPVLADRCQLKAHTEMRTLPVYEMGLAKGGPRFKPASPPGPSGSGAGWSSNNGAFTGHAIPMASLADMLANELHRTIIDTTGLEGRFDFELKWAAEPGADASPEASTASLFTALEEQLGLKLRSSKGPVEVLVVEHVEMPSEN